MGEVYFDDFKVEHIKSPVIQSEDYYPFGLAFNNYSRERSFANQYQYNGKEMQDELNIGWLDYGSRMYMPEMARWNGVDLVADQFYNLAPYSYVDNNPVNNIDPDGEKLVPVNQRREFRQAIRYLKQSPTGREVIRFLKQREERILVGTQDVQAPNEIGYSNQNGLANLETNRVQWNAYRGRKNSNGSKSSAAMTLIHELGHIYYNLLDDPSHTTGRGPDEQYDDTADAKVIPAIENVVAIELGTGEGTRTDHQGESYETDGPISRTEKQNPSPRANQIKKEALRSSAMYLFKMDSKGIANKKDRREFMREKRKTVNHALRGL